MANLSENAEIRAAYGTGTIETLGPDKHRLRVMRDGKRVTIDTFPTWERANEIRTILALEVAAGAIERPSALTFRTFSSEWLTKREVFGNVRGIQQELSNWNAHVSTATWYTLPVQSLTRTAIANWVSELLTKKALVTRGKKKVPHKTRTLSRLTVKTSLRLVRQCLDYGVEQGVITSNPAKGIKVGKVVRAADLEDKWTFLSAGEISSVLGCDEIPQRNRFIFAVAIYAGLRRGELFSLRWEDVSLANANLHVRRSLKGPTKSGKARWVPLLAPALDAMKRWHAESGCPSTGLVFPGPDGSQYSGDYQAGWSDSHGRAGARTLAGIKRAVRFHDLRHTAASHLVIGTWGQPWTLLQVRDFLGHGSVTMTERYAHLAPDSLHRAAATLDCPALPTLRLVKPSEATGIVEESQPPKANSPAVRSTNENANGCADLTPTLGNAGAETALDISRQLLVMLASGQTVPAALVQRLASAVLLASPKGTGPHVLRRALDLAGAILTDSVTSEPSEVQAAV